MRKTDRVLIYIWRLIYPIFMFLGTEVLVTIFLLVYYVISQSIGGNVSLDSEELNNGMLAYMTDHSLYLSMIRGFILIPLYALLMKHDVKLDKINNRITKWSSYNKLYLLLLPLVGVTAAVGVNGLVAISGLIELSETYQEVSEILYTGSPIVLILSAAVIAPLVEELLFRGLLYKRLREHAPQIPAMVLSSMLFGLIHGNLVQFVYATMIGIFLAYVYDKFKTIWAPIIFHAGANLFSIIVTLLSGETSADVTQATPLGEFMLFTVVLLAITFLLLFVIEQRVNREEIE